MKKKVCFISHSSPTQLGGVSLYYKHLINYLKNKNIDITWAYSSDKNKRYSKKGINYVELKQGKLFKYFENNWPVRKFLKRNHFEVVFTTGGHWALFYKKPIDQKIIHIFHGTVHYFYKNHFNRFGLIKQKLLLPLLTLSRLAERPHDEAYQIICVSDKVKKQVEYLYDESNKIKVIRTGVDLNEFKPRVTNPYHKDKLYGLYVGSGGHYTKGLDRAINLSREIYKLNQNYRLIVIGPDKTKVGDLLNEKFVEFKENVPRNKMKDYYNLADIFLCMSRYEGGAPTLVVSEAMASGCLVVCSKDSEQEIIKDHINGLIIKNFDKHDAHRILTNLQNKELIINSLDTIKELSLENWGDEYFKLINN